jgi:hypothetical protein
MPQQGINVLALLKGNERYVFLYDDRSIEQVLQTIGRYAADPELRVRKLMADATATDIAPSAGSDEPTHNRIRRSAA